MKPLLTALCLLASVFVVPLRAAPKPDVFAENIRTTDPLPPEEERLKFQLPPGFKIQLVAAEPELRKPMNMAFDSVGRLWITESREYPFAATNDATARDTIRIFSDFDDNGRAHKVTTFATNLNIPIGLYPFRSPASNAPKPNPNSPSPITHPLTWKCVVWSIPNIYLLEDTDGDGVADKKELLYGPFDTTRDTHGNQASFRRGLDGWIYATHGFNNQSRVHGRDGHEIFLPSGNIYRFKLDGSRIEHWTHGQVNPFGLCFDPLGNLYSADCHSSPIYQLLRGAHYPSFGRPHDGLGFGPTTIQHSHGSTAIAGIVYISDPAWPAEYQNNIFIGNVMTSRINRDEITFTGSTSKGKEMPDFLRTDDPWFRPVDIQYGPDGALWVADFYNRIIGHYEVPLVHPGRDRERGRIWRIVPPGKAFVGRPKLNIWRKETEQPTQADLVNGLLPELFNSNATRSRLALEDLLTHQTVVSNENVAAATKVIFRAAENRDGAEQNGLWLWLLERQGLLADSLLLDMFKETNQTVRVHALRILTERGLRAAAQVGQRVSPDPLTKDPAQAVAGNQKDRRDALSYLVAARTALNDPSAHVQRAAADALAANPHPDNLAPLLDLQKRLTDASVPGRAALRAASDTKNPPPRQDAKEAARSAALPEQDTHLAHVVRLALREQLRLPGAFAKLSAQPLAEADARAFAVVAGSVTNAEAATFLLRHVQAHAEPADVLARYVTHAARYAPDAELGTVATLAKKQFAADLDTQAALFKSLQDGLASRGGALPADLRAWGTDLAGQLLAAAPPTVTWTYVPLNADKPGPNPFAFEERNCADGQRVRLMSSFPHGETLTGILRSPVFVLPKQLSFYLCGHDGPPGQPAGGKNFVRLRLVSDTDKAEVPAGRAALLVGLGRTETSAEVSASVVAEGRAAAQPCQVTEQPCHSAWHGESLWRIASLLLPAGEGWGEGECSRSPTMAGRARLSQRAGWVSEWSSGAPGTDAPYQLAFGHHEAEAGPADAAALLPHPGPLPLGEGNGLAALGSGETGLTTGRLGESLWRTASLPLPAGEGWGEGEGFLAVFGGIADCVRAGGASEGSRWEAEHTHRIEAAPGRAPEGALEVGPRIHAPRRGAARWWTPTGGCGSPAGRTFPPATFTSPSGAETTLDGSFHSTGNSGEPGEELQSPVADPFLRLEDGFLRVPESFLRVPESFLRVPDGLLRIGEPLLRVGKSFLRVPEPFLRVGDALLRVPEGLLRRRNDFPTRRNDFPTRRSEPGTRRNDFPIRRSEPETRLNRPPACQCDILAHQNEPACGPDDLAGHQSAAELGLNRSEVQRETFPLRLAAAPVAGDLPKGVVREAKVPRNDTARKITWDLADLAGKRAVLEVTDGDNGKAYAWLAFGRFVPALPELALSEPVSIARRQQAGADLARVLKLATLEPAVTKLFSETTDAAVRASAGRAWISLNAVAALTKVEPLVRDAAQPENLRAELAAQLGESAEARGLEVVVAALTNAPSRLQTKFAAALAGTAAGSEQLLAAAEAGRVPARLLQDRTLADRLGASPARDAKARLAALVKNLPPADVQLQKQIEAKRAEFKPQQASAARGAEVFTKACAVCHQLGGQGALVGPQLDGIGGRGLERLLEDILDPNRNVDKAFRTTVFVLKDGESVSGLMRREEGATLVYALANGQEARVAKADVKERRETETSLMPANFIEALPAGELNDLLAFLLGQRGK